MPKAPSSRRGARTAVHRPLAQDVQEDRTISRFGHVRAPRKREEAPSDNEYGQQPESQLKVTGSRVSRNLVDPRLSRKILKLAREQQDELEQEEAELEGEETEEFEPPRGSEDMESEEDLEEEEDEPIDYGEMEISPEDRALLEQHDAEEDAAYDAPEDLSLIHI